jgi:pimeloyl-ACP methyl ester carboxylesterase
VVGDGPGRAPIVFVHAGGGPGGAYWRVTPDGRPGWAEQWAARGRECWVTEFPGVGRSASRDDVGYDEVVDGYEHLLGLVGRPSILVAHSMGGYVAWKLVDLAPASVAGIVAVACPAPGNLVPTFEVVEDDGRVVVVAHNRTGVRLAVDRAAPFVPSEEHSRNVIAAGGRFPAAARAAWLDSIAALPPRLALQRFGLAGGLPVVEDPARFAGLDVLCVTAGADASHTREIDGATVALLRSWGAVVEHLYLPDVGVSANGHFMMVEDNSATILELVDDRILHWESRRS